MNYRTVLVETNDQICIIKLNNPASLNALSDIMIDELSDLLDELEKKNEIRIIIFTGEGKAFIAGGDIAYMSGLSAEAARKYAEDTTNLYVKMRKSNKIFIAAINGYALGGGCEFALACDLRLASEYAKFGLPEVSLGVIPGGGGTQRLPRLVGTQKALELILTGEIIGADEALKIGLITQVVPKDELMPAALVLAKKITKNAPLAVKYARECIRQSEELTLSAGIEYENTMFGLCFAAEDQHEGMTAFLEKREAKFSKGF